MSLYRNLIVTVLVVAGLGVGVALAGGGNTKKAQPAVAVAQTTATADVTQCKTVGVHLLDCDLTIEVEGGTITASGLVRSSERSVLPITGASFGDVFGRVAIGPFRKGRALDVSITLIDTGASQ